VNTKLPVPAEAKMGVPAEVPDEAKAAIRVSSYEVICGRKTNKLKLRSRKGQGGQHWSSMHNTGNLYILLFNQICWIARDKVVNTGVHGSLVMYG
jgi:hypothetical protein